MPCSRQLTGVGCQLHSVPCGNRLRREWSPPKRPETTRDGVGDPDDPSTKGPERRALELTEATGPRTERPRLMASACGGFELLCWTGIRYGELLALTPSDFMLEGSRLRINKSYQSLRGVDTVTDPKTLKSVRAIVMPAFLRDDVAPDERLFAVTKHFLAHEAVDITYRYARLFPTKQDEMAAALDGARG